jgi:hypothetical protein
VSGSWIFAAPLIAALVCGFAGAGSVQAASGGLPANASAKSYGDGWTCDRGFRATGGACQPIEVPENALATQTSYGRGWECRRGFEEVNGRCNAIAIPANAYLNAAGTRWECDRGFRPLDNRCTAIEVPENGYLTGSDFGSGWKCERGFRATGTACLRIELPANAHIDYSGNDWECDRPYSKLPDGCVLR